MSARTAESEGASSDGGRRPVAVVTGGARGLGGATVKRLLADGYRVAIVDVLDEVEAAPSDDWHLYRGDVADRAFVESVASDVAARWGTVDALVNNAGIFPRRAAADLGDDEWNRVLSINLTGTFVCAQVFGRMMLAADGGAIVNTASGQAFSPNPNTVAYSASKGGIVSFTRALAIEWAPRVRVNCVVPGMADTAMPRVARSEEDFQAAAKRNPMGRAAAPTDIAGAVAFLLSPDAAYITGQTIGVNGGAVLI